MKRTVAVALMGAALTIPMAVDAQRVRPRAQRPAERYVEAPASGRLTNCRAPRNARSFTCRPNRRIIYRSVDSRGGRAAYLWTDARWARTTMRLPVRRARYAEVGQQRLRQLIGARAVRQIRDHGRRAGLRGSLRGHWLARRSIDDVLVLTMRGREVGRLIDYDRDGYVDDVLLRNFRRAHATW